MPDGRIIWFQMVRRETEAQAHSIASLRRDFPYGQRIHAVRL
jgi:hypothetical protein